MRYARREEKSGEDRSGENLCTEAQKQAVHIR